MLLILTAVVAMLASSGGVLANNSIPSVFIPQYTYMSPDSFYLVLSQIGEPLSLSIDLHKIPLNHIPFYIPTGSRCVVYQLYHKPIVIYAIGEGGHILPPPDNLIMTPY